MGAPIDTDNPDLISIHEFANRYRVDVSIVRGWVKRGSIPYTLVGNRKMLRTGDIPKVVKQVDPVENRKDWHRRRLVGILVREQGMDIDTAREVVKSMGDDDVDSQLTGSEQQQEDKHEQGQGQRSNPPRPASTGKGANDNGAHRRTPRRK